MTHSPIKPLRNFSYRDFPSAAELVRKKERAGLTISLVVPALNEARTIGPIINLVQESLVRGVPLVDEIIVMDGLSEDATREISREAGATVYSLPEAGPPLGCCGKGVALWKSQFVSRGDILVFIDADIMNFGSHFITGLVGPLLEREDILFVKGYYRRPLRIASAEYENFGGRITEILVRPMLSALQPDLAAVFQPLGGEYAIRRDVLESLPFASGYGVEIGMLFDFSRTRGLGHMAQVDLDRRVHRNRPVGELGRAAFGVLQVMMRKLEDQHVLSIHGVPFPSIISQGIGELEETAIEEVDLPPRREIPEPVAV